MQSWKDYAESILVAVFLAFIVRTFIFTGYKVPTSSMSPTLVAGDFIFSNRMPYGIKLPFTENKIFRKSPGRGEVVVFTYADQPRVQYVKRVIGLPGDKIEIKEGRLEVNGEPYKYEEINPNLDTETFTDEIKSPEFGDFFEIKKEKGPNSEWFLTLQKGFDKTNYGPIVVPPNELFLLGDNRDSSDDSRYWGTVPINRVEGRVVLVWLSLDWKNRLAGSLPKIRWHRVGLSPH